MTDRSKTCAERIVDSVSLQHGYRAGYTITWDEIDRRAWIDAIAAAYERGRESMREECAKVAEEYGKPKVSAAIRALPTKEPSDAE